MRKIREDARAEQLVGTPAIRARRRYALRTWSVEKGRTCGRVGSFGSLVVRCVWAVEGRLNALLAVVRIYGCGRSYGRRPAESACCRLTGGGRLCLQAASSYGQRRLMGGHARERGAM